MSKRKSETKSKTDANALDDPVRQPITASQGKLLFKQMAKDTARGNPLWSGLLALIMPFLMKLLESFFAKYDVIPKSEG